MQADAQPDQHVGRPQDARGRGQKERQPQPGRAAVPGGASVSYVVDAQWRGGGGRGRCLGGKIRVDRAMKRQRRLWLEKAKKKQKKKKAYQLAKAASASRARTRSWGVAGWSRGRRLAPSGQGQRDSAAAVSDVSSELDRVRVEQNHCQGLQTARAS